MSEDSGSPDSVRLDKWLWAARFFKTRHLAVEAINGGKIKVNALRAKPARAIAIGNRIEIQKGGLVWDIEVLGLSKQRRSATEAGLLYREDESSRLKRQEIVRERRDTGVGAGDGSGRPTKRDRRLIQRFKIPTDSGG
ncbi:RNA-binding S4 domain-containing protein [Thiocapsa bogorovii]|uniref:RNA-binding S4 domain-containing protein n=1 Tax=Thiocapsa bogorovii TaxID=521689 RepID=UPI001E33096D|nr:S4 domain-containing protein [Thiocapsa bogorovii]UHD16267.1 RNA-binding S4 domain-containing protein [Thiocapsa bogorovii]